MTLQSPESADRLRQGDISYLALWVPDVARAARFYAHVLKWTYAASDVGGSRLVEGQSISLGLAELSGASAFLRSLGVPLSRALAPTAYPVFVVEQIEAGIDRVRAAGGFATGPMDQPYGRVASCIDDQGLVFSLHEAPSGLPAPRPPATGTRHGDVGFLAFEFPDAARARAFYASVFGLQFQPGRVPDSWNIPDMAPMAALNGGYAAPTVVPMWRVDDIRGAVERVRAAGGTATDPLQERYGSRAECTDDQGVRFYLGQL